MPRSHPVNPSPARRTWSIANPVVFTSPADAPKMDKRPETTGNGQQGLLRCPTCGHLVTAFKASYNLFSKETMDVMGIKTGDLLVTRHTPDGKRFRARGGDVRCQGSELPVLP